MLRHHRARRRATVGVTVKVHRRRRPSPVAQSLESYVGGDFSRPWPNAAKYVFDYNYFSNLGGGMNDDVRAFAWYRGSV